MLLFITLFEILHLLSYFYMRKNLPSYSSLIHEGFVPVTIFKVTY